MFSETLRVLEDARSLSITERQPGDSSALCLYMAEKFERRLRDACFPSDNYIVELIRADNDEEAAQKADAMRPYPKMKE